MAERRLAGYGGFQWVANFFAHSPKWEPDCLRHW